MRSLLWVLIAGLVGAFTLGVAVAQDAPVVVEEDDLTSDAWHPIAYVTDAEDGPRDVRVVEMLPVVVLLFLAIFMTVKAEPVMRYMQATATALHDPTIYVRGVLGQTPLGQTPLGWSDAGGAAPGTEGETTP